MLPESWIDKIFTKLQGRYGVLFINQWKGCDVAEVKREWAEELGGFKDNPECIAYALRDLDESEYPPSLPKFLASCRSAPRKELPQLKHVPTPEEIEHQRELSHQVSAAITTKLDGGINRHWATHPRSYMHLRFIFDAAKNDARFKPCIAEMVAEGICTAEGKLLKRYAGTAQWVKA